MRARITWPNLLIGYAYRSCGDGDAVPIYEEKGGGCLPIWTEHRERDALPMGTVLDEILRTPETRIEFLKSLRILALKVLNDTQLLILYKVERMQRIAKVNHNSNDGNGHKTLNALLEEIRRDHKKALSTLKLNAKILKELGFIDYGEKYERRPVELTVTGRIFLEILEVTK